MFESYSGKTGGAFQIYCLDKLSRKELVMEWEETITSSYITQKKYGKAIYQRN